VLSYRHLFHAGGFADVFKHALLARFPLAFQRKPAPWFYLDTHAGTGLYDLTHAWAVKRAEHEGGIARVWQRADAPPELQPYLEIVRTLNSEGRLLRYPGSPELVRRLRRKVDRMVMVELNAADCSQLQTRFAGERNVSVLRADGFTVFHAQLPPRERRGMVLIDAAFDRAGEFDRLLHAITAAHRRWATGTLAVWYPMMQPDAMRRFERRAATLGVRAMLQLELTIHPEHWQQSLRGCGMLVVNPPYGFEVEARAIVAWLGPALAGSGGSHLVRWLVPE